MGGRCRSRHHRDNHVNGVTLLYLQAVLNAGVFTGLFYFLSCCVSPLGRRFVKRCAALKGTSCFSNRDVLCTRDIGL